MVRTARQCSIALIFAIAASGCAASTSKPQTDPQKPAPAAAGTPETQKPAAAPPAAAPAPETQKPAASTQKPAPATQRPAAQAGQKPSPTDKPAPGQKPEPPAKPQLATAADKTPLAYEVGGSGPALILVQGAGETRRAWQERGYADRLKKQFTVITFDRRGTGDSGKPVRPDAYTLDTVLADILTVADAAGAKRFHVWGFGDGAAIVRYLAARSDRVISAVIVGTTMGPALTGIAKDAVAAMRTKWQPLIEQNAAGTLDVKKLSPGDRAAWENGIAISALSLGALLDAPPIEPGEIKAPTLWLVGIEDEAMKANLKEYEGKLQGTSVTLKTLGSLSYSDTFIKSDAVLAEAEPFLLKTRASS